jgi:hypothetical protein
MNFRLKGHHSVILMSVRRNSPYRDEVQDGTVLIYEGHDEPRREGKSDPKTLDQPKRQPGGSLTENCKINQAAQMFKLGKKGPDIVQVYEKIKDGIWTDNGFFHLVDAWIEQTGVRSVFKFKLIAVENVSDHSAAEDSSGRFVERSRIIPTQKFGRAIAESASFAAKGMSSTSITLYRFRRVAHHLKAENVQLLCARHNLSKSANVQ